jgi:hypothetical protein
VTAQWFWAGVRGVTLLLGTAWGLALMVAGLYLFNHVDRVLGLGAITAAQFIFLFVVIDDLMGLSEHPRPASRRAAANLSAWIKTFSSAVFWLALVYAAAQAVTLWRPNGG